MRTFHTGGVVGLDITSGLPRIVELFEARTPKGKAVLSLIEGKVKSIEPNEEGNRLVTIVNENQEIEVKLLTSLFLYLRFKNIQFKDKR